MKAGAGIRVQHLTKLFGSVVAADEVCLDIRAGEFLTVLGPSGSGKTTLLRLLAGFEYPTAGRILVDGEEITELPPYRRSIGMVFQNYALFPHITVFENIAFPLRMRRADRQTIARKVGEMLGLVRLKGLQDRHPRQLSGGQQQRVARALVFDPPVLLLDEPLGALDKQLRLEMQFELKRIQQALGTTAVNVTHDQEEALSLSDRIAVMHKGRLVQVGTPDEIYNKPVDRFVAEFIGEANFLECDVVSRDGPFCLVAAGPELKFPVPGQLVPDSARRVVVALRPEKVRVSRKPDAPHSGVRGTVAASVFTGDAFKLRVHCGEQTLLVKTGEPGLAPEQTVCLDWAPEACIVLPPAPG